VKAWQERLAVDSKEGRTAEPRLRVEGCDDRRDETAPNSVWMPRTLFDELVRVAVGALPRKAYGLVGGTDRAHPVTLYPCSTNIRDTPGCREIFESFGSFYQDPERGFVVAPEESSALVDAMAARGERFVGVYHSHRCRGAEPSELDVALHYRADVHCYIVSVVDPARPDARVYEIGEQGYREVELIVEG
jgi:proteasome lid subunit RPN8/RPN11